MIKVLAKSDNYRSIKAGLYNVEETNGGPCTSKGAAFGLPLNLGYEYETNMFAIHCLFKAQVQIMISTFKLAA